MKRILKGILFFFLSIFALILILFLVYLPRMTKVLAGYNAKILCSCVYISEREPADIIAEDLGIWTMAKHEVDRESQTVSATVWGMSKRTAIYREGLGCTLVSENSEAEIRSQNLGSLPEVPAPKPSTLWPRGDSISLQIPAHADSAKLYAALDWAFSPTAEGKSRGTRAVVIAYDSMLVAEKYGPGFDASTPLGGWSMAKTVTQAQIGILVRDGKLDINSAAPVPLWQEEADDPRKEITTDQLLRMSSGLSFSEFYYFVTDATKMLFLKSSAGEYAASRKLKYDPDTRWAYSSGTSNILANIIRHKVGDSDYWGFPHRELLYPIGMRSAVVEPDANGTYIGSSLLYATGRDWARFGLLYLWDGVWYGNRIFPEGWVDYSRTPTPAAPKGMYGAHVWLNAGSSPAPEDRRWSSLPPDIFFPSGFEGQYVFIIPSRKLVIARLGYTPARSRFSEEEFLSRVLEAFPVTEAGK